MARKDPDEFNEYVLRDERPEFAGRRILSSECHQEMQMILSKYKRAILWSHFESGKTAQISIGRTLFELGLNPQLRVAIVSATGDQATKISDTIRQYIENSNELHEVFPNLVPGDVRNWGKTKFTIRRPVIAKDPTVQVATINSSKVTGARIDLAILDDALDPKNVRTKEARDATKSWYIKNLYGRLGADSRVWFVGNAQHPEDMMHEFAAGRDWYSRKFPILTPDGKSNWAAQWPMERILKEKNSDLMIAHPEEWDRQYMCIARDDVGGRFKREWIDLCLRRGVGKIFPKYQLSFVPEGFRIITGVDIGGLSQKPSRRKKSDLTVFFTLAIHPNGDREILDISSGRWVGLDLIKKMLQIYVRFKSIMFIEANAAQMLAVNFAKDLTSVPVQPFNTGTNKTDPVFGLEAMSVGLANGKWIIPSNDAGQVAHKEIAAWIGEVLGYIPTAHPGDRLMASWIAHEGANTGLKRAQRRAVNLYSR